jgi:hypothetical protein
MELDFIYGCKNGKIELEIKRIMKQYSRLLSALFQSRLQKNKNQLQYEPQTWFALFGSVN